MEERTRAEQRRRRPQAGAASTERGESGNGGAGHSSDRRRAEKSGLSFKALTAAAVALALGLGIFFAFSGGGDPVDPTEAQANQAAYAEFLAGPGLPLVPVSAADLDQAIASLPDTVPEKAREELRADVGQGRLQLAWLTLWDTHVEDGDVLRFESVGSIPVEVKALNSKTTIAIPYPADGKVHVTGVKDGGGGITIALESGTTTIRWPTMAPGDQLDLPVTPGF